MRVSKAWLGAKCEAEISTLFIYQWRDCRSCCSPLINRPGECIQLGLLGEGRIQGSGFVSDPWLPWHLRDRISSKGHPKELPPASLL